MKNKIKDLTIQDIKNICNMNLICNKCKLYDLCYPIYKDQKGMKTIDSKTMLKEIDL